MIDLDLQKTSGIVKIPLCTLAEVILTLTEDPENSKDNINYPCPA